MNEIFTQADHLNLILLHYQDRMVTLIPMRTHGSNEFGLRKSIKCPYTIGKLYVVKTSISLLKLGRNHIMNDSDMFQSEPELLASDIDIPANATIMFLGLEILEFEDRQQQKNGAFLLKFLMQDSICYYYIPVNFKFINNNWINESYLSIENLLANVLKNVLKPI